MSQMHNRGGQVLCTGKIGRLRCLRQQMLRPGETIKPHIKGNVRMEALRERDSIRANAQLFCFMTPLRWLWADWPNYVRQGPNGSGLTPPTVFNSYGSTLGIGGNSNATFHRWFQDNYFRVYNEWFKWPEVPDLTAFAGSDDFFGSKMVPLAAPWSRVRDSVDPDDAADASLSSATSIDVRDLARKQAEFVSAMDRDVLSFDRYQEILDNIFGAEGSREVDQVPMLISHAEAGIDPRDVPAQDGASLGQWMSLYDFEVDHACGSITAPEHCIVSYFIGIRFASINEDDTNPLAPALSGPVEWAELVGDPRILEGSPPSQVRVGDVFANDVTTALGELPAGWRWRTNWNHIGHRIDNRNSFPIYTDIPTSAAACRDATRINPAFRSSSLGDFVADLYFDEPSWSDIPSAMQSYKLGEGSRSASEFVTPRVK